MKIKKRKPIARKSKAPTLTTMKRLSAAWDRAKERRTVELDSSPGLFFGVPFRHYQNMVGINNSSLKPAMLSMAHYHYVPTVEEEVVADYLTFGNLVHSGHLEPELLGKSFCVMPAYEKEVRRDDGTHYDNPRATKAYKELAARFISQNPTKQIVTQEQWDTMTGMLNSLNTHKVAKRLFQHGEPEVTMVWMDGELKCKGRLDYLVHEEGSDQAIIVDLKTTLDLSLFHNKWSDYGYHRQAAFYCEGFEVLTGIAPMYWIVAVEKQPPYAVLAAPVNLHALTVGRAENKFMLRRVAEARAKQRYPGPSSPECWTLPTWYKPSDFTRFYMQDCTVEPYCDVKDSVKE